MEMKNATDTFGDILTFSCKTKYNLSICSCPAFATLGIYPNELKTQKPEH